MLLPSCQLPLKSLNTRSQTDLASNEDPNGSPQYEEGKDSTLRPKMQGKTPNYGTSPPKLIPNLLKFTFKPKTTSKHTSIK